MNFFKNNEKSPYTVVIGCGRVGASLANKLSDDGKDVLIIDKNEDSFRKLSSSYGGLAICGDGTDYDILYEAKVEKADSIVIVTNNDNINIMVSQIVSEIAKAAHIIVRLYDPERESIYKEFGIDTICPAILSANAIDDILATNKL